MFSELIMTLKILYRKDTKKIYFIITHRNIILEYTSNNSKQIYNIILKIRNGSKIAKSTPNYLIANQIISDLYLIVPKSEFFSK